MKYLIFLIIPIVSFAGERHHHSDSVSTINSYSGGTALSLAASQHVFDISTYKTQVSIAAGRFRNQEALSVGVGKRFDGIMFNGSVGIESDDIGFGAAMNFRF